MVSRGDDARIEGPLASRRVGIGERDSRSQCVGRARLASDRPDRAVAHVADAGDG
jgi:hypothetical protein